MACDHIPHDPDTLQTVCERCGNEIEPWPTDDADTWATAAERANGVTRSSTADIIEQLAEAGLEPRAYSGRGMYGKECVGVALDGIGDGTAQQIVGSAPRTDSLGRRIIAYWPHLSWPEGLTSAE